MITWMCVQFSFSMRKKMYFIGFALSHWDYFVFKLSSIYIYIYLRFSPNYNIMGSWDCKYFNFYWIVQRGFAGKLLRSLESLSKGELKWNALDIQETFLCILLLDSSIWSTNTAFIYLYLRKSSKHMNASWNDFLIRA